VDHETFKFPVINQRALFVRKCYHELYEIVTKLPIAIGQSDRILLTGTPGIGKSTFLIYFTIRYLYESTMVPSSRKKDKRSVTSSGRTRDVLIFQPANSENEFYAFAGPNIVRMGTYSDFEAFFLLPTTWYLVDWKSKPVSKPAATLFALSPDSIWDEDFKDFEKVLAMNFCMPVWAYDELEECRCHVFPELSNRSLNYIYDRVGGVARSCLELPTMALRLGFDEEQAHEAGLRRLQDAFKEVKNPLNVLRAQEKSSGSVKVSGHLLHRVPDSEYRDGWHRVWASAYVIDRFANMMDTHSANNMSREVMEGLARNERDGTSRRYSSGRGNFETFTFQKYHNEQGKVSQKVPNPTMMLEQWVLSKENAEQPEIEGMKKRTANEDDMRQPQTSKKRKTNRMQERHTSLKRRDRQRTR